ncbi:uncharacterized protein LOC112090256 isoform X2 [Morus notabilis]|uniref:uncharacterized protein LOC112090256 isoform X2 n=1 Tax=Morus notabilis TaxID=981085 RepID=UPI000CECF42B|nr:uncharacterized protein LOC112090256 isoform X2 [Morus notabilis]
MEPAKIDWKNLEWKFVQDELYEHINAPKWFDFLSSNPPLEDDDAWFCRPDCNHPKTAQDFLKSTPPKIASPAGVSEISPLGHRNQRDAKVKRRALLAQAWLSPSNSNTKFNEDCENLNPNLSTPPPYNNQSRILKAAIKSSAETKEAMATDEAVAMLPQPRLKSTLSARNLFAGRDILNQISDFCSELKRMAMRPKERENEESAKENVVKEESKSGVLSELDLRGKEKPFQEMEGISILKEKQRRKKIEDIENIPISVNLENIKRKEDNILQIRTNPPSPQCFSATRKTTSSKSKLMERGVLQEQNKQVVVAKESIDKNKSASIVESREAARTLDVFWFLKPCTLSTYNNA